MPPRPAARCGTTAPAPRHHRHHHDDTTTGTADRRLPSPRDEETHAHRDPPGRRARRRVLLGRRRGGPAAAAAVRGVRRGAAPAVADVPAVPEHWTRVVQEALGDGDRCTAGSCRTTRPSPTPSPASWRSSSSRRALASCRNLSDVDARRRRATSMPVEVCFAEIDGVVLPQFRPVSRVRGLTCATAEGPGGHRRHRPDRVLEGSGRSELQLAAEAALGGHRRRRAHAGRHRRHGHVHARLERRAAADALPRASPSCAYWSRTPHGGAGRAHDRPARRAGRRTAARPTRCSCTGRSTSGRAAASASPTRRSTPPGWNWYLPFGLDTPAKIYSLGSSATCTATASPTRTSAATRSSPASTRPPTRTPGSTSGRSRSTTTRAPAGSSSRSCACSTAARRATAASRSW